MPFCYTILFPLTPVDFAVWIAAIVDIRRLNCAVFLIQRNYRAAHQGLSVRADCRRDRTVAADIVETVILARLLPKLETHAFVYDACAVTMFVTDENRIRAQSFHTLENGQIFIPRVLHLSADVAEVRTCRIRAQIKIDVLFKNGLIKAVLFIRLSENCRLDMIRKGNFHVRRNRFSFRLHTKRIYRRCIRTPKSILRP